MKTFLGVLLCLLSAPVVVLGVLCFLQGWLIVGLIAVASMLTVQTIGAYLILDDHTERRRQG